LFAVATIPKELRKNLFGVGIGTEKKVQFDAFEIKVLQGTKIVWDGARARKELEADTASEELV